MIAVVLVVVFAASPKAANLQAKSPLIGKTAPALSGKSYTTGTTVSMSGLRGRFVLVNFFGSWCQPCAAEASQLVSFAAANRSNVTVLGVAVEDAPTVAARFVTQHGGSYPVIDPPELVLVRWGVRDPPTSFLIAPDGKMITKIVGQVTASGLDHLMSLAIVKGY